MSCDDSGCNTYKVYNFCPVKLGDTFPRTVITATVGDTVKIPLIISEVVMQLYKYGREDIIIPTSIIGDGVVEIGSVDTSTWDKTTYQYQLKFTLDSGKVVSFLSGVVKII